MNALALLFYDANCRVCRLSVRGVVALDRRGRLRTAPIDSPEGDRHLGHLPPRDRNGSFHLLTGGRLLSGPEAIGPLLNQLPALRPVASLMATSPATRRAAAATYEWVSRNRGWMGRFLPRVGDPPR